MNIATIIKKTRTSGLAMLSVIALAFVANAVVFNISPTHAATATVSSCSRTVLRLGSAGDCVKVAQTQLNTFKYCMVGYRPLVVDGKFGSKTLALTKEFQRFNNISADGIIGPVTWSHLADPCRG